MNDQDRLYAQGLAIGMIAGLRAAERENPAVGVPVLVQGSLHGVVRFALQKLGPEAALQLVGDAMDEIVAQERGVRA